MRTSTGFQNRDRDLASLIQRKTARIQYGQFFIRGKERFRSEALSTGNSFYGRYAGTSGVSDYVNCHAGYRWLHSRMGGNRKRMKGKPALERIHEDSLVVVSL